jgi:hypothetical protein
LRFSGALRLASSPLVVEGDAPPRRQGMWLLVTLKLCLAHARASSATASARRNALMPVHAALPKRHASCFSAMPNFAMCS